MNVRLRLVLASALMLFLELALIRWLTGNVVHLGYFSNFVLLGSFLGVGLGFLRWNPDPRPARTTSPSRWRPSSCSCSPSRSRSTGAAATWCSSRAWAPAGRPRGSPCPVIFCVVAVVLAGPGELVAACFNELPRLEAYRWDIIGSLLGIASFTVLSFLRAPSFVWGTIAAVLIIVLLGPIPPIWVSVAAVALVGGLVFESSGAGISWSPYYKVQTSAAGDFTRIDVNGVPHQDFGRMTDKVALDPQYLVPYDRIGDNPIDDVLIVGAGSGTDVELALSKGAKHVDAVEIDPRIQQIGEELNPDKPYSDPRVTVHINDGRAFLERTDKQYDLIIFALPDSLTLVAGASQLRLESYLFTEQSLEAVQEHLKPGGAFAMYNYYREDWLVGRLGNTAAAAFGHDPCIDLLSSVRAVIVIGKTAEDQTCGTDEQAVALAIARRSDAGVGQPAVPLPEEPGHPERSTSTRSG